MKQERIAREMAYLAQTPGVEACALVESATGLVWHAVENTAPRTALWEAAVDYWRLHGRASSTFQALGGLRAAVLYHRDAVLAILPCSPDGSLLMVCIGGHRAVDWIDWQGRVRRLQSVLHGWTAAPAPHSTAS